MHGDAHVGPARLQGNSGRCRTFGETNEGGNMRHSIILGTMVAALAMPLAAHAQVVQGTVNGAQQGAATGSNAAGPIGGIVGGAVGAGVGAATGAVGTATGIVGSIFGVDQRPRFHEYVEEQHYPSYAWRHDVRVGAVLPRSGLTYYPIPDDYTSMHGRYRYARVNDRTVVVDPRTRRIVDIID